MKKSILLIGYNYSPEPTGIGRYSGEQIQWLAQNGYNCTVLASYPYYPYWKVQEPYSKNSFWYKKEVECFASGGKITVHRCPMFIPQKPSGATRILLDFTFFVSALLRLLLLLPEKRFDFVITILPSVSLGLLGIIYKKIRGAKLICHVHDLQIEAARDLKMIKYEKVIQALFKLEKYIFDECDTITCVGEGMANKVKIKAAKDVCLFFNTTDLNEYYPLTNREQLKKLYGYQATDKIILYSGAIGEKQGIEAILYAAEANAGNKDLKFVICGSGPYKERLQDIADEMNLQNLDFLPLQPLDKLNQFLNMADIHLIIQKANAGDLVMPSKLNTVLAIGGLAVVTANKGSGMHTLIERHNMGVLVEAENQQALNEGIQRAIAEDASEFASNARHYAEMHLSIDKIMHNFEESCLAFKYAKQHAMSQSLAN
ncbi:WcaI family glycosyltransferase [Pontibacter sp. HSC-36F09]|uniref:WcaI family glycosyltransferase n=1 Tax=Pontibacter sp. HSC-36F09 TaxID=2910966 RepID=UPI00209CB37C|nr:WcaI family glycosyltransferase [Pontibacter sp. HSC-36F09]MCP2045719.1 colanic acid biosynthesis glycosyl transferase WcaI [Pontibacter sp. HSC-36F09]